MRLMTAETLVVATHNQGKLAEFRRALAGQKVEVVSAADRDLPEPEETGTTFEANALLKARAACAACGDVVLADDSGLAVAALGGAPGIYSARWAGPGKDFAPAFQRICDELSKKGLSIEGAEAAFVAVLAMVWPDGHEEVAEGRIEGHLTFPPRGEGGFGYDPVFMPNGETRTFAEMTPEEKGQYSHRMQALAVLRKKVFPNA